MALLIDVRSKKEFDEYHAPGALLIPLIGIACGNIGVLADTDKGERIELYCRSGARSGQARQLLVNMGFTEVINLGGLDVVKKRFAQATPRAADQLAPSSHAYWFRPARFWKWFAFYYPVSRRGWAVTLILIGIAGLIFSFIDRRSHSVSDTLFGFAPWLIALMAVFDMMCFRRGEYPSWWQSKSQKRG